MKRKTIYIGMIYQTAEYIWHDNNYELCGVICEKNRVSDELFTWCLVRNVELFEIENKQGLVDVLQAKGSEYIYVMYSFGIRIPMEKLPEYKIFNIHPSKLPKYKGAQPTYWATVGGEKEIGVSMFKITENFDDGEIIDQVCLPYYIWENEIDLSRKSLDLLPRFLNSLTEFLNEEREIINKNATGSYYPKVTRKEVYIDVKNDDAALIYNKVRAEAAFGGAKVCLGEKTYCLYKIVFKKMVLDEFYIIKDGHLYIKYRDGLVIDACHYCALNGIFKFRDEK